MHSSLMPGHRKIDRYLFRLRGALLGAVRATGRARSSTQAGSDFLHMQEVLIY